MALSVTYVAGGAIDQVLDATGHTSTGDTSSNSYTAGDLVVIVGATDCFQPATSSARRLTISATGWTFTPITTAGQAGGGNDAASITAWYAIAPSTASKAFTLTATTSTDYGITYHIWKATGYNSTTPIGGITLNAMVRSLTWDGALSLTLDHAPTSNDTVLGYLYLSSDTGANKGAAPGTSPSTWTEDGEWVDSTYYGWTHAEHLSSTTSTTVHWADLKANGFSGNTYSGVNAGIVINDATSQVAPYVDWATVSKGTSGSSVAANMPSPIAAGDLLLLFCAYDSTTAPTTPAGWTLINGGANSSELYIFGKIAAGSDTVTVSGPNQDYVMICGRVPAANHSVVTVSSHVKVGTAATGTSTAADPPSASGGSTAQWLAIASCVVDLTTGSTISAAPAGYVDVTRTVSASSTSSCALGVATLRSGLASSVDPGAFTNSSRAWRAQTILIPPGIAGSSAQTLSGATLAASGSSSSGSSGTLAVTLAGATLSASGTETISGTLASTFAGATLAASGTEALSGTLASTLEGATLAGSGTEAFSGTFASTLDGATFVASGAAGASGTLAATFDAVTLAGAGTEAFSGTLAATLDGATLAGSGAAGAAGTLASTLAGATLAASAVETITGTLASTLDGATFSGSGAAGASGALASTLDGATLAASGVSDNSATGTFAATLAGATLAASAVETITGTLASTLDGATFAASGETIGAITGTLASTLEGATSVASGAAGASGTFASTLDGATSVGTGVETFTGTLASTLNGATVTASGTEAISGTATSTLDGATFSCTALQVIAGVLAVTLADAVLAASGTYTPPNVVDDPYALTLAIYDRGHTGSIYDRGHTGSIYDRGHTGSIYDRGHTGSIYDRNHTGTLKEG